MSTEAQINVRLDRSLKERGDAALSQIGLSPSAAVRLLWGRAAERGESLAAVRRMLCGSARRESSESVDAELDSMFSVISDGLERLRPGIDLSTDVTSVDDDATIADDLLERYAARGLV